MKTLIAVVLAAAVLMPDSFPTAFRNIRVTVL